MFKQILALDSLANRCTILQCLVSSNLELVNLVLVVTQLLKSTLKLALVLRRDLVSRDSLVHWWWAANEDLHILLWLWQNSLQQLLVNKSLLETWGILWWLVQDVESTETLWEGVLKVVKLVLEEDILRSDVTKDKSDLGLILWVVEDGAGDLETWRDTSSSGDQSNVLMLVCLVWVLWQWALELKALIWSHLVDMRRHRAVLVLLDQKGHVSALVLVRDRGVGSDGVLLLSWTLVASHERRSDLQAGDVILIWKSESELLGVVVDVLDLLELEGNPVAGECWLGSWKNLLLDFLGGLLDLSRVLLGVPVTSTGRSDSSNTGV